MKILVLEDYSGFGIDMKKSLIDYGHDARLLATTRKYEVLPGDVDYFIGSTSSVSWLAKAQLRINMLLNMNKIVGYDVVFIINQSIIFKGIAFLVINFLSKNNGKIFLSVCGMDSVTFDLGFMKKFKYNCPPHLFDQKRMKRYNSAWDRRILDKITKVSSGVIPITYEYAEAWRCSKYSSLLKKTIPIPFYTKALAQYQKNKLKNKIKFYHGKSRPDKGTDVIESAFNECRIKYGQIAEFIIGDRLPYREYIKILNDVDVLVDQCAAASYGSMNTLLGMSLGKVVMTQNASEALEEIGLMSVPVVKIENSTNNIVKQIDFVINSIDIDSFGKKARSFVESFHSPLRIAAEYDQVFLKN